MRLVIDLQGLQTPQSARRGVGRYTQALTEAMLREAGDHEILLMLNGNFPETIDPIRKAFRDLLPLDRIRAWRSPPVLVDPASADRGWRVRAAQALRESFLANLKADVVHISSMQEGFDDEGVTSIEDLGSGAATGAMLYDLSPIALPDTILAVSRVRDWYMDKLRHTRRARRWLAISEMTRHDAINLLELPAAQVINISGAAAACFRPRRPPPDERTAIMARFGLSRRFVMYFGGFDPHKNVDQLLRAFSLLPLSLRAEHQLILVGVKPEQRAALTSLSSRLNLKNPEVRFLGTVDDADLVDLLGASELFVYPSVREGLGLPVLEAMATGTATLCGNRSSLPEIMGRADAMFDPTNAGAIAERIHAVLQNPGFRDALRAYGLERTKLFSWRESARRALDAYEALHDEESSRIRGIQSTAVHLPARPRLAWLADWPLDARRLNDLRQLSKSYDIDLLLPSNVAARTVVAAGMTVIDIQSFASRVADYDRVVVERTDAVDWLALSPAVVVRLNDAASPDPAAWLSDAVLGTILDIRSGSAPRAAVSGNATTISADLESAERAAVISDAIEQAHCAPRSVVALTRVLGRYVPTTAGDVYHWKLAEAIAANQPPSGPRRLLVDVSTQALGLPGTGIARTVLRIAQSLLSKPPDATRVELVRAPMESGAYVHARRLTASLTEQPDEDRAEEPVEFRVGDQFLALDLNHTLPAKRDRVHRLRELGGQLHAVVYDLLPLQRPDWFPTGLDQHHRAWFDEIAGWDNLHCISQAVASDVRAELERSGRPYSPRVSWFHLGSDLPERSTGEPLPELSGRPNILMVSTVWARKGHAQALDAMELLWKEGVEANLVIVGRPGWGVEDVVRRMRAHPQRNRRLFWYAETDDGLLAQLYATVDGVLIASEAEGFGLPLVEALHHRRPVLARDLPVFRELVGDCVRYFEGLDAASLAMALRRWLLDLTKGHVPHPETFRPVSWAGATQQLLQGMGFAPDSGRRGGTASSDNLSGSSAPTQSDAAAAAQS